jgi:four helix bundle protein
MSTKKHFEVMDAWQAARALSQKVFEVTAGDGFRGNFELRSRMQKASVSIMSNIAEGFQSRGRVPNREYLKRAEGFAEELRGEIFAALDGGCVTEEQFRGLQEECTKCRAQIEGNLAELRSGSPPRRALPANYRA